MEQSLIIFRGLPGTGKTYLINKLFESFPRFVVLNRDELRLRIFEKPDYTVKENLTLRSIMLVLLSDNLKNGCSVIIDGMTFSDYESIEPFIHDAQKHRVALKIIECNCSEQTALNRIERDIGNHPAGDRDKELYFRVKKKFREIDLPHIVINTEGPAEKNLEIIIDYLES